MYAVSNDYISIGGMQDERITGFGVSALTAVELAFVDNWAGLSRAFGMGADAGRIHAVLFLAGSPMTCGEAAALADLSEERASELLLRLLAYGAADRATDEDGQIAYASVNDPWTWFSSTIRHRARREFAPLMQSIRSLQSTAKAAHRAGHLSEARLARIARFSSFVDQVARLVETFGSAGSSRPMLSAARTMARFICG